ncbi:MAG: autorepressor SdpR family transcription factor [Porcipelethomonas sp.]
MGFPETFKALSDPVRREILTMLKSGRKSAGEIASHFDMTNATVSYHLSQLKKAGLVYEEKEKNFVFYSLNISVFEEIMMWISQFTNSSDKTEKDSDNNSGK